MKRNSIAAACAAVLAVALVLPFAMNDAPTPDAALRDGTPAAETASESQNGPAAETTQLPEDESTRNSASAAAAAGETGAAGEDAVDGNLEYEQDAVLVGLQDGVTADQLNARLADLDYIATKSVAEDNIAFGYVELELADGVSVEDALERIESDDGEDIVSAAQPNYLYHLLAETPESPAAPAAKAAAQGNLTAAAIAQSTAINDARKDSQWALEAVKAYRAWDTAKGSNLSLSKRVTVAILDNGCLTTHEDLKDNIAATYNAVNRSTDVSPAFGNHGTHVAGIVAATANNGIGIAGVSYNARVLPIQVFEKTSEGVTANSGTIVTAYNYIMGKAKNLNIRVVNMSLGEVADNPEYEADEALIGAVNKAYDAGILTVCSSGNSAVEMGGAYLNYPSDWLDNAIGVIASTKKNERASYSNYNTATQTTKKIMAPGSNILSTDSASKSSYGTESGTSMAAPCVAGIAALVYSVNPGLSARDVSNILRDTATDLYAKGWDRQSGYGLVNAAAAVEKAMRLLGSSTSFGSAVVKLSNTSYTYDGKAKEPDVTVSINGATLKKGTDYTVSYSNNTNAGTAKVVVAGKGSFSGSLTKTFTIKAKKITPTVTLGTTKYVYNGGVKKPAVTVKDGSTTMPTSNYTLTYAEGREAVGKYTVKVVLKGNYSGSASKAFTIVPATPKIQSPTALSKGFTAKWSKQATQTTGYQVQCSLKKNYASGNKVLPFVTKNTTVSQKATGLKANTTYYVRVRAYKTVNGTKYYSAWSGVKAVKTKA